MLNDRNDFMEKQNNRIQSIQNKTIYKNLKIISDIRQMKLWHCRITDLYLLFRLSLKVLTCDWTIDSFFFKHDVVSDSQLWLSAEKLFNFHRCFNCLSFISPQVLIINSTLVGYSYAFQGHLIPLIITSYMY